MRIKKNSPQMALLICLIMYGALVLVYTVIDRGIDLNIPKFVPFWSYAEWLSGNRRLGRQILGNIAMFCPIGFLAGAVFDGKNSFLKTILTGFFFSCVIEAVQWVTMRGMLELDDIIDNSLGLFIGWIGHEKIWKRIPLRINVVIMGFIAVAAISIVCIRSPEHVSNYPNAFCFQADGIEERQISGFAFRYGRNTPEGYKLLLESTSGEKTIKLDTETGLVREDVNEYFEYLYKYSHSGFTSIIPEINGEYEFVAEFSPFLRIPTGVYISAENGIHYIQEDSFSPPEVEGTDLEEIVKNGTIRVYRPDFHCWIYQYGWALYWITDEGFIFEDDGTTLIQFHMHTTQTENLPPERLEKDYKWDNSSSYFEKYELDGNFGQYRVMKRELATEYAVTSITTGYYKNGKWIWREYFRPIYNFIK